MSSVFVFVGFVGAGKSTQINLLSQYLKRERVRVRKASIKTAFFVTYTVVGVLRKIGIKPEYLKAACKATILLDFAFTVFFSPVLSFRINFWRLLGYTVLVEEYLQGILVDFFHLSLFYGLNQSVVNGLMRALYQVLHLDGMTTIVLTCDASVLPARWKKRGTVPEEFVYLRSQKIVFEVFKKSLPETHFFSTDKGIYETLNDLLTVVGNSVLKSRGLFQ